ncbi:MAG: tyrosine-type recombinase/integrase [Ilumatobacteraceae bacterium]
MSSITTIRDKSGRAIRYRARYRTPEGASRTRTFAKKVDAELFLTITEHKKAGGDYVDASAGRITFRRYSEGWLDSKALTTKPTTGATWLAHMRAHIWPTFGETELRAITREQVRAWAAELSTKVQPTTARGIVFTLAAVLRDAVDDGRIVRNHAAGVRIGAKTERRVDPMHISAIAGKVPEIADAMPERWRAAVLLMASTGLRLGECLGLTVDRVDFLRRTIRIDRQLANTAGGEGFSDPKTRAGVRTIPVSEPVIDLLAAHLSRWQANEAGLIFTMSSGRPVTRSRWSDHYRDACAVAEVDGRTRTHDLRHVAASSLIAHGLSVSAVQAVLGHSSPSETLDVYTHLWPTDEERTRAAMTAASGSWLAAIR